MRRAAVVLSAGLLVVAACGGSDSSSVTGSNNNGNSTGAISATIDGKSWAGLTANVAYSNSIVSFAGTEAGTFTTVSVAARVTGPGTYNLGFANGNSGIGLITQNGGSWSTASQSGTGTLVITTLSPNHLTATFSFDAPALTGGATGTRHLTSGRIDTNF